jgi:hypothetical protein
MCCGTLVVSRVGRNVVEPTFVLESGDAGVEGSGVPKMWWFVLDEEGCVVETLLRDSDVVGIALGGQRLRYWYTGGIALCELVAWRGRFCVTRTSLVSRLAAKGIEKTLH